MNVSRRHQRGVAALEFAILMPALLVFLMLVLNAVMMFAARQSLSLAAAEGARAALRYGSPGDRATVAKNTALTAMAWLQNFGATADAQLDTTTGGCSASAACFKVTTKYNYCTNPLMVGMSLLGCGASANGMEQQAIVQLDAASTTQVMGTTP